MPEKPTLYHASVYDLRHALMTAYSTWGTDAIKYSQIVFGHRENDDRLPTDAERDAYGASLMASSYAYTLAAIIKMAEQEFGPEAAHTLANEADNLLMNGDDEPGWNGDVIVGPGV